MFISDGVSKVLAIYGSSFSRISLITRFAFETIIVFWIILKVNYSIVKYLTFIFILLVFFLLGQSSIGNINDISESFITFNKYIYLFLVYLFLREIIQLSEAQCNIVFKLLYFLFFINILCVLCGYMFKINFFEAYYSKEYRFGYNGVFLAPNESSYIFMSMVSLFYYRAIYENKSKVILILSILASLITGMKAVYLFLILLLLFHAINHMKKKYLFILISFSILLFGYLIRYLQSDEFKSLIALFIRLYEEKGLLHMLLTGRDDLLINESPLVFKKWTFINYLTGGVNIKIYSIEMDFFDLLLFFGLLGSILYVFIFFQTFINGLLKHAFAKFFIFSILALSFFGGHFLYSPSSAVYFSLVIIYFRMSK